MADRLTSGALIRDGQSEPNWFKIWHQLTGIISNPIVIEQYGNYIFLANNTLFVSVELDNFSNPVFLDSISIFGSYPSPSVTDIAIASDGSIAYVTNFTNGVMQLVNISDPSNLTLSSILVVSGLLYGVCVQDNNMYTCARGNRLIAWDISNPAVPTYLSEIAGPSSVAAQSYYVKSLGNYLYICSYNLDKIGKVNISNPASITTVGSLTDGTDLDGVWDIALNSDGTVLYACSLNTSSVISLDVTGSNPVILDVLSLGAACLRIDVKGDFVYVLSLTANSLYVVDASNPSSLSLERTFTLVSPRDLVVANGLTYVAEQGAADGLSVLKAS